MPCGSKLNQSSKKLYSMPVWLTPAKWFRVSRSRIWNILLSWIGQMKQPQPHPYPPNSAPPPKRKVRSTSTKDWSVTGTVCDCYFCCLAGHQYSGLATVRVPEGVWSFSLWPVEPAGGTKWGHSSSSGPGRWQVARYDAVSAKIKKKEKKRLPMHGFFSIPHGNCFSFFFVVVVFFFFVTNIKQVYNI